MWLKAVPSAINKIHERGIVDNDKLGVYGQSNGGYAVNLLITQTDRFVASANVSGKVNMISFLGHSPRITTRNYRAAENGQDRIGSSLWEQPQKYIEHSAIMFADRIETPLLMLSGEGDWNVPATNQREMYYVLRRLGKDVVSCGASMSIIAFITDPVPLRSILTHLDLPSRPPPLSPARAPPQGIFDFDQTAGFGPTDPEPIPEFEFDQSLPD